MKDDSQVLVLVPKRDELTSVAKVFEFDPDVPDASVDDTYPLWRSLIGELRVDVVCANAQGSTKLALATGAALRGSEYGVALCIGTAAGREEKTGYLDVVIGTAVLDAQEWRVLPNGFEPQWDGVKNPSREALGDIDDFSSSRHWQDACRDLMMRLTSTLPENDRPALNGWPRIHDGWVATTSMLHQDAEFLAKLWGVHSRLRCVDMESAGFVEACEGSKQTRPWFVIRSISDFGTVESKRDGARPAAGIAVACVARAFIEGGLRQAHPVRFDRSTDQNRHLSSENVFASLSIASFLAQELRVRLDINVDPEALPRGASINDTATYLASAGRSIPEMRDSLDEIREHYFTQKYANYRDEADVRGFTGDVWADEIFKIYEFLGVSLDDADVLYVGIGTGRDVPLVLPRFGHLAGADVSAVMLERAKEVTPALDTHRMAAENLRSIASESTDVYLSLRTYQSSMLDIRASIREAHRVLRQQGGLVISIPGGIVDRDADGVVRYVPGLNVGGTLTVNPSEPRRIANVILDAMHDLAFERIGFHQQDTDLYIYGRKNRLRPPPTARTDSGR